MAYVTFLVMDAPLAGEVEIETQDDLDEIGYIVCEPKSRTARGTGHP